MYTLTTDALSSLIGHQMEAKHGKTMFALENMIMCVAVHLNTV